MRLDSQISLVFNSSDLYPIEGFDGEVVETWAIYDTAEGYWRCVRCERGRVTKVLG